MASSCMGRPVSMLRRKITFTCADRFWMVDGRSSEKTSVTKRSGDDERGCAKACDTMREDSLKIEAYVVGPTTQLAEMLPRPPGKLAWTCYGSLQAYGMRLSADPTDQEVLRPKQSRARLHNPENRVKILKIWHLARVSIDVLAVRTDLLSLSLRLRIPIYSVCISALLSIG